MQKNCLLFGQQIQTSEINSEFDPRLDSAKNLSTDRIPRDAEWWAKLKEWILQSSVADRQDMVGRLYWVEFSQRLLGGWSNYNRDFIRCIGYDCDGDKTLIFQTMCCSYNAIFFGNGKTAEIDWFDGTTNSLARQWCINYYNDFPGKESVKTVQKKYNSRSGNYSSFIEADKVYDETFFLPSYAEMGFSENIEICHCMDEFCVLNTNKIPYQYYTNDNKRRKTGNNLIYDNELFDGNTDLRGQIYWLRSFPRKLTMADDYLAVDFNGQFSKPRYSGSAALAPAFVIG